MMTMRWNDDDDDDDALSYKVHISLTPSDPLLQLFLQTEEA